MINIQFKIKHFCENKSKSALTIYFTDTLFLFYFRSKFQISNQSTETPRYFSLEEEEYLVHVLTRFQVIYWHSKVTLHLLYIVYVCCFRRKGAAAMLYILRRTREEASRNDSFTILLKEFECWWEWWLEPWPWKCSKLRGPSSSSAVSYLC